VATDKYLEELLNQAMTEYPFIARHDPHVVLGSKGNGYAETYPIGETGKPLGNGQFSRPSVLPIDKLGIEIFKPDNFSHKDLVGEVLHGDPVSNQVRQELINSLTTSQLKTLKYHALDYGQSKKEGMPEHLALRNLGDAAIRGYLLGQFPDEVNKQIKYTPYQLELLNGLHDYMKTPLQQQQFTDPMQSTIQSSIPLGIPQ
jgi:hypothetical protein